MSTRNAVLYGGPMDGHEFIVPIDADGLPPWDRREVLAAPPVSIPVIAKLIESEPELADRPGPPPLRYHLRVAAGGQAAVDGRGRLMYAQYGTKL